MRRVVVLLVALATLGAAARADDPGQPRTITQAADAVLAAVRASAGAALQVLAQKDEPDPWLVADELIRRGEQDAALSFASGATGKDTERLREYVAADGSAAHAAARRALEEALERRYAKNAAGVLAALSEAPPQAGGVVAVRAGMCRAWALDALGRRQDGAEAYLDAANRAEQLGWLRMADTALATCGNSFWRTQSLEKALEVYRRLLELREVRGDRAGEAHALASLAQTHLHLGSVARALSARERSLSIHRELKDVRGEARQLSAIGMIHRSSGAYAQALSHFERAFALFEELGDGRWIAGTLRQIGLTHEFLGDWWTALACYERERALFEEIEDRGHLQHTLLRIGHAHRHFGDVEKSRSFYERSLALARILDDPLHLGLAHDALSRLDAEQDEHEAALQHLRRAGDLYRRAGHRAFATWNELDVARVLQDLDRHEEAVSVAERALAEIQAQDGRMGEVQALQLLGELHEDQGSLEAAARYHGRALRLARRTRSRFGVVSANMYLARVHLAADEPERALSHARQGLDAVEHLLGGLAEGEGVAGREGFANLFGAGVLAAARLADPAAAVEFLESGRAGALLETLGGGRAVRYADLPAELVAAEVEARAAEAQGRRQHAQALDSGDRERIGGAAAALDRAVERRREIVARMQREAKRAAGVLYPRAALLEEIQDELDGDAALVLYGLCLDAALALVLTHDEARFVELGSVEEVESACLAAASLHDRPGARGPLPDDVHTGSPEPKADGLVRLRSLLIEPLALGEKVETILVSPAGALGYVPWGALLDRPVACVPSGTTWLLLREEGPRPGRRILALGDPAYDARPGDRAVETYRGGTLRRLPATRPEAIAIGDDVLLAEKATETGLIQALRAERRWRAVHLACHGLVDTERPLLSSLALTPGDGEDGFLTCLDIFGMDVPADLVVLSACETARGKVAKAEGIVGLTRAFMYAGSPRVLCSLWKVDDDATRALMTRFYELWNPKEGEGLSAAEALRKAQAFVRGHERWTHPYYWAAWVLWGLPQ